MAPPTTGPTSRASPVTLVKIPRALARRSGGNAALNSVSASGITSADPHPCRARAAISQPAFGASAQAADASDEQAQAPEAVAERRASHEQHREAQGVGVYRPLDPCLTAWYCRSCNSPAGDKRTLALDGAKGLEHMMDQQKGARPVQRRAQGLQRIASFLHLAGSDH